MQGKSFPFCCFRSVRATPDSREDIEKLTSKKTIQQVSKACSLTSILPSLAVISRAATTIGRTLTARSVPGESSVFRGSCLLRSFFFFFLTHFLFSLPVSRYYKTSAHWRRVQCLPSLFLRVLCSLFPFPFSALPCSYFPISRLTFPDHFLFSFFFPGRFGAEWRLWHDQVSGATATSSLELGLSLFS